MRTAPAVEASEQEVEQEVEQVPVVETTKEVVGHAPIVETTEEVVGHVPVPRSGGKGREWS